MGQLYPHSFEAGRRGKPDEFESQVAMLAGARILEIDPLARFDLRVRGGYDHTRDREWLHFSGEVSEHVISDLREDLDQIAQTHYEHIYRSPSRIEVTDHFKPQSRALAENGKAGDSGNPIAVAIRGTPLSLPWERYLAVGIRDLIDTIYQESVPHALREQTGIGEIRGLGADGKVQVDTRYDNGKLESVDRIIIAATHDKTVPVHFLREELGALIQAYIERVGYRFAEELGEPTIIINGAGDWPIEQSGWRADEGTREAKPYRDGFATWGCNEDSISGEDPTKPGLTGLLLARNLALRILKEKSVQFARVSLDYIIGSDQVPVGIITDVDDLAFQQDLERRYFDEDHLRIKDGIERFNLRSPELYRQVAKNSDFFQDVGYGWNQVL